MPTKTVLIVDDHPAIADSISMAIRDLDSSVTVRIANSMFQAMATLNECPSIEFCLLDLILRDTKGEETLLTFRRVAPKVPVIVFTGLEIDGLQRFCMGAGALAFVPKAASRSVLANLLEKRLPRQIDGVEVNIHLTARQKDVLQLLLEGMTVKEIATKLSIGETTVQTHVRALNSIGNCRNRVELAAWARSLGINTEGKR
jgi:DNA-binding NarL/FixJ family response regulator